MDPQLKKVAFGLSAALAVSLSFLSLAGAWRLYQPLPELGKTPTISVSGEGKVVAKPDIAEVSFSVVTQGNNPAEVQRSNDEKMTRVVEFLKSQGVKEDDIRTTGYNLYPQYDYDKEGRRPPEIIGYSLTQTVAVKVRDLSVVGKIVGGVTEKGANQINSIGFSIDNPDSLKEKAREEAIKEARERAEVIASQLGARLGKVVSFSESPIAIPMPFGVGGFEGRGGGSPIEAGTEEITVTVSVTYAIR